MHQQQAASSKQQAASSKQHKTAASASIVHRPSLMNFAPFAPVAAVAGSFFRHHASKSFPCKAIRCY
jgi:hypothetical protein